MVVGGARDGVGCVAAAAWVSFCRVCGQSTVERIQAHGEDPGALWRRGDEMAQGVEFAMATGSDASETGSHGARESEWEIVGD